MDLSRAQLNAFYAELLRAGRRNIAKGCSPAGLAPETARNVHTMLHKALHDAVRWGQLVCNSADRADLPRPMTPEMKVWRLDQLRTFLVHVEHDRLFAARLLLAMTGMRRGELLGLRREEIDLKAWRLAVVSFGCMVRRPQRRRSPIPRQSVMS